MSIMLISCRLAYKKHITGKYYIIAIDTKDDKQLSYSLGLGNFVGKVPGNILEYGSNDSLLIAKTKEKGRNPPYYIINMEKDFDTALEEVFRIGPISQEEFDQLWKLKLNIPLNSVEK